MPSLADRLVAIHAGLDAARVPHAFGGAIALAYCTEEPRGTRDIDLNLFVPPDRAGTALDALPDGVTVRAADRHAIERDGQARLWWDDTPVDVFFDVHDFHLEVGANTRTVPFNGTTIPVLDCTSLAVFKVMFNRTRDWADIEAMAEVGTLDVTTVLGWIARLLGPDDAATRRLASLLSPRP